MISKIAKTDPDKRYVSTNERGDVQAFYVPDLQYTTLGRFIIFRLKQDRDVKILITGSGKTTGTGKTTLAIHLARYVNNVRNALFNQNTNWSTQEYSFMNAWEYLENYREANPGDPLITDELEYMADRRRAMSDKNMYFSQAWSVLRWKNVVTIGTAPGLSDLEKRIPEGADVWLNVVHKGRANSYYITVHDFDMNRIYKRFRLGKYRESILWNPIEADEDYQWLKQAKEDIGVPGLDSDPSKREQIDESDMNQLEKNIRNQYVKDTLLFFKDKGFYNDDTRQFEGITQGEVADLCEVSQPQVSKLKRELEKAGEL